MMSTGNGPWNIARKDDETFVYMTNGFMKGLLKSWDLLEYVDRHLLDLFQQIFQRERDRFSISQIKTHQYVTK